MRCSGLEGTFFMNVNTEKNCGDDEEIDFIELWHNVKPFLLKSKYWLIVTPILSALVGFFLASLVTQQWEAVSLLQIGRVSKSELVEPVDAVIARMSSPEVANIVLAGYPGSISDSSKELYRKTLAVRLIKPADSVEVRVRGYSKEEVSRLASLLAKTIEDSHASAVAEAKKRLAGKLANAEKIQQRVKTIAEKFHNGTSADSALAELAVLSFSDEIEARANLARADLAAVSPTVFVSVAVADAPVYPNTKVWLSLAGILGLFLGIAVSLVLYAANLVKLSK